MSFSMIFSPLLLSFYVGTTSHWAENISCRGRRLFNIELWLFHMLSQMENHKAGAGVYYKTKQSLEKGENICMAVNIKHSFRKSVSLPEND